LNRGSRLDAGVWDRYSDHPDELRQVVEAIRAAAESSSAPTVPGRRISKRMKAACSHVLPMVNNVIGVVNYVIAARPSLLNFVIADSDGTGKAGRLSCLSC
jgi:hypothetical protein